MPGAHLTYGVVERPDGRLLLHGPAARLCRWFDDQYVGLALAAGAEVWHVGPLIGRGTLDRAGYFDPFPDGATRVADAPDHPSYCLSPAVCYHVYERLTGTVIAEPLTVTAGCVCHRKADRTASGTGRLWEFTMREIVFIGTSAWVVDQRDQWMPRIGKFAASVNLRGSIEPATDPFFGDVGRGKRLLQQLKGLKHELRLPYDGSSLAVASFNLHETFFGERFAMTLASGATAHSACVAFGLERWTLAFLEQHGDAAADALINRHLT